MPAIRFFQAPKAAGLLFPSMTRAVPPCRPPVASTEKRGAISALGDHGFQPSDAASAAVDPDTDSRTVAKQSRTLRHRESMIQFLLSLRITVSPANFHCLPILRLDGSVLECGEQVWSSAFRLQERQACQAYLKSLECGAQVQSSAFRRT